MAGWRRMGPQLISDEPLLTSWPKNVSRVLRKSLYLQGLNFGIFENYLYSTPHAVFVHLFTNQVTKRISKETHEDIKD